MAYLEWAGDTQVLLVVTSFFALVVFFKVLLDRPSKEIFAALRFLKDNNGRVPEDLFKAKFVDPLAPVGTWTKLRAELIPFGVEVKDGYVCLPEH